MAIDFKDEYATLRQEMLERFGRIHDTAKYGTGAFIAFLSYYYKVGRFDDYFFALVTFQLLVALIGLSALRLYQSIYDIGSYIAAIIEQDSEGRYHRMNRQRRDYERDVGKRRWTYSLPFPLGKRWGGDSAQFAILLVALTLIGLFAVLSKNDNLKTLFCPFCAYEALKCLLFLRSSEILVFTFIVILLTCNVMVIYKLWWGMKKFMTEKDEMWKQYKKAFGTREFPDKYI